MDGASDDAYDLVDLGALCADAGAARDDVARSYPVAHAKRFATGEACRRLARHSAEFAHRRQVLGAPAALAIA